MIAREFDVILYGASGFTGRQTVEYFRDHAPNTVRWAIAGRNETKLNAVAQELLPDQTSTILIADGHDRAALDALCQRTRVVLTTAGPFSVYGRALVDACVAHNTHYLDITGETPFVADLIQAHHESARQQGTRIIPFAGFDSVPSDLGALLCAEALRSRGTSTRRVVSAFKLRGGLNGGTVASALAMSTSGRMRDLRDVLLLNPENHRSEDERRRSRDVTWPVYEDALDCWLAPFVMAPINSRVVRRSNALFKETGAHYGDEFEYVEGYESRGRVSALMMAFGLKCVDTLLRYGPGRALVKAMSPSPGRGPSQETMDNGFFRTRLRAEGEDGSLVGLTLSASGDPGNRVTVTALCESALALAGPITELPGGEGTGGVLTPAVGLGSALVRRLENRGWVFEFDGDDES